MKDFGLWAFVKRSITPLGQPVAREPRMELVRREDVFDLHDKTTAQGFEDTHKAVNRSFHDGLSEITIITGRSGIMRQEFPHWMQNHPYVRSIEPIKCGGAFRVKLRKPNTPPDRPR